MPEEEIIEKPKKTVRAKKKAYKDGFYAVGRRKTSVARICLVKGNGTITINGKGYEDYVAKRHNLMTEIVKPFAATSLNGIYSVDVKARGGGVASTADAVKLGIARALIVMDPELKSLLSKAGCLVRDPRMKERKKYGRKRARKRFQYSKR